MTTTALDRVFTPEGLLRMEDSVSYELVDGKLVQRHSGMLSSNIAARVAVSIGAFLHERGGGHVFGADAGYQCFPNAPSNVRKPDASFVRTGRFPGGKTPTGHCPIPPDLAVEVISPNDLAYDVDEKVNEYSDAGVPLVWVVSPPTRTVRIHRPRAAARGPLSGLSAADVITGEDVLPGFSCTVAEFFP
jgi:Uma2 family endonuclease